MYKLATYINSIANVKAQNDLTAQYFETWEEAHAALVARCVREEGIAAEVLERARKARRKAEALAKPKEEG